MEDKRLKEQIRSALTKETVDYGAMEKVKRLARENVPLPQAEGISFLRFTLLLAKFTGIRIWLFQGIALTVILSLFWSFTSTAERQDPRFVAFLLCCLSSVTLMTALPILQKSRIYKMQAIEAATRFSMGKLLLGRLVILGIGNGAMMAILCFVAQTTLLSFRSAALYVLFPFLLSGWGLSLLIPRIKAEHITAGSMVLCGMLVLAFRLLFRFYPALFAQSFTPKWAALCAALAAWGIFALRHAVSNLRFA